MRRFPLPLWALIAGAGLLPGCGTPGKTGPLAWIRKPDAAVAKTDDAKPPAVKDDKPAGRNPFRKTDAPAAIADAEKKKAAGDVQQVSATVPKDAAKPPAHDAETLKLIETELRDATPAERDQLFADLKGLNPSLVREILKVRRLVRQMGQQTPGSQAIAQTAGEQPADSQSVAGMRHIAPPAASETPHAPARQQFAGLGTASPWGAPVPPADALAAQQALDVMSRTGLGGQGAPLASAPAWNASYSGPPPAIGAAPHSSYYLPNGQALTAGHSAPGPSMGAWNGLPVADLGAQSSIQYGVDHVPQIYPTQVGPAQHGAPASAAGLPQVSPGVTAAAPSLPSITAAGAPQLPTIGSLEIQPAAPQQPAAAPPLGQYTPRPSAYSPKWNEDVQRLVALAETEAAQLRLTPGSTEIEKRDYVEKQVYLRMLYLMSGQQERALQAIPGVSPADQEFWQQMFWALANYFDFDAIPESSDRAAQTIAQLRAAISRLQENARLEIRNVAFCHKIFNYGQIEKFQRDEFSPGQPVLVYAELSNFKSEPTADGQFRTILYSTLEIHRAGAEGGLVERLTFPATEDLCRNQRRDYFHSYEFTIPSAQKIALGPHVLKLTIEDQLSRKLATYTLNFMVK